MKLVLICLALFFGKTLLSISDASLARRPAERERKGQGVGEDSVRTLTTRAPVVSASPTLRTQYSQSELRDDYNMYVQDFNRSSREIKEIQDWLNNLVGADSGNGNSFGEESSFGEATNVNPDKLPTYTDLKVAEQKAKDAFQMNEELFNFAMKVEAISLKNGGQWRGDGWGNRGEGNEEKAISATITTRTRTTTTTLAPHFSLVPTGALRTRLGQGRGDSRKPLNNFTKTDQNFVQRSPRANGEANGGRNGGNEGSCVKSGALCGQSQRCCQSQREYVYTCQAIQRGSQERRCSQQQKQRDRKSDSPRRRENSDNDSDGRKSNDKSEEGRKCIPPGASCDGFDQYASVDYPCEDNVKSHGWTWCNSS